MLKRSVDHDGFSANAPMSGAWFDANPQGTEPDEAAYAALVADLAQMQKDKTPGVAGTRINYTMPGTISLFKATARNAGKMEPPYKEALLADDAEWADPLVWVAMREASNRYTTDFYMVALDLKRSDDGGTERVDEKQRIYLYLFVKTFILSAMITFVCLLLAFPIAHLLATLPMAKSNLLMILVLLPFWTSLLVRTTSWIVLLQEQGVVNNVMVAMGVIEDETAGA